MSFRRAPCLRAGSSGVVRVAGVRAWLHGVHLTSTGVDALDKAVGGGLPLSTLTLVLEDAPRTAFHRTLLQHAAAEGIARGHALVVCSPRPDHLAPESLPFVVGWKPKQHDVNHKDDANDAVRRDLLQHSRRLMLGPASQPPQRSAPRRPPSQRTTKTRSATSLCCSFDLSRPMQREVVAANAPVYIDLEQLSSCDAAAFFSAMLQRISAELERRNCCGSSASNVGRIILHAFASPQWTFHEQDTRELMRFLQALRSLVRRCSAVAVVSIAPSCMSSSVVSRIKTMFDVVLGVHSFAGRPSKYGDYDALLKLERVPHMHSWSAAATPDTLEYLLKIKRRKLLLDRLALPPEHSRDGDGKQPVIQAHVGCSGQSASDLSF